MKPHILKIKQQSQLATMKLTDLMGMNSYRPGQYEVVPLKVQVPQLDSKLSDLNIIHAAGD